MNRRSFFGTLLAPAVAPVAAKLLPAPTVIPAVAKFLLPVPALSLRDFERIYMQPFAEHIADSIGRSWDRLCREGK